MATNLLRARLLHRVPSPLGLQADLVLIEPNGDEHHVRCLAKGDGTEINGETEALDYLNKRYGSEAVCFTARNATQEL